MERPEKSEATSVARTPERENVMTFPDAMQRPDFVLMMEETVSYETMAEVADHLKEVTGLEWLLVRGARDVIDLRGAYDAPPLPPPPGYTIPPE